MKVISLRKIIFVALIIRMSVFSELTAIANVPILLDKPTLQETEPNNMYTTANRSFDDYTNKGTLNFISDIDWWVVKFDTSGSANFWLGDIPAGCNYNVYLYASNGTTLLAASTNSGNASELFSYAVTSNTNYYIKICSVQGGSSSQYTFRTKNYPYGVTVDRVSSVYSDTYNYRGYMTNRMNCYGYSMHTYYSGTFPFDEGTTNEGMAYYQTPGEFAADDITYNINKIAWGMNFAVGMNSEDAFSNLENRIYSDFYRMNVEDSTEWFIKPTTLTESIPSGYRKIALVLKLNGTQADFHFYVRHDDGTWSHKPGNLPVTNMSSSTHEQITDSNMLTKMTECGYVDGIRFYLVKKSFVIDYPHQNGHRNNSTRTTLSYKEKGGEQLSKSMLVPTANFQGYFDSPDDHDFIEIRPSISGMYRFEVNCSRLNAVINFKIYNSNGQLLRSENNLMENMVNYALTAGNRYFLEIHGLNGIVGDYELHITH